MKDSRQALDYYNRVWARRYRVLQDYCPAPWWSFGLIVNNEIHYNYERYFPIVEYLSELRLVFNNLLPDPSWVPLVLEKKTFHSLPDFWRQLPQHLAGKVTWEAGELFPLACALASPRKNGCHSGRYPEQHSYLCEWLNDKKHTAIDAIDYGCATGQGTYELAGILAEYLDHGRVIGVTKEPLEAWMARNRSIPYFNISDSHTRKCSFPQRNEKIRSAFVAGDIHNFSTRFLVDLIVCNGLIGGPDQNNERDFRNLWDKFRALLRPGGVLMVGNRFHDGLGRKVSQFLNIRPSYAQLSYEDQYTSVFTL